MIERGDQGSTLIEVLIAVVVLGIVFVGSLTTLATSTLAAGRHRQIADGHAVLLSAAERLKSPTEIGYVAGCPTDTSTYLSAIRGVPLPASGGWTPSAITISTILYWNGTTFDSTCANQDVQDANGNHILRLQLVTVTVTGPDGKVTENLSVVKRGTT